MAWGDSMILKIRQLNTDIKNCATFKDFDGLVLVSPKITVCHIDNLLEKDTMMITMLDKFTTKKVFDKDLSIMPKED